MEGEDLVRRRCGRGGDLLWFVTVGLPPMWLTATAAFAGRRAAVVQYHLRVSGCSVSLPFFNLSKFIRCKRSPDKLAFKWRQTWFSSGYTRGSL